MASILFSRFTWCSALCVKLVPTSSATSSIRADRTLVKRSWALIRALSFSSSALIGFLSAISYSLGLYDLCRFYRRCYRYYSNLDGGCCALPSHCSSTFYVLFRYFLM